MALAFALGRWSKTRQPAITVPEADPWIVVSEMATTPTKPPRGEGRQDARGGRPAVREVASQAPCTYTVLRGHAKGRFMPLPEAAQGLAGIFPAAEELRPPARRAVAAAPEFP